MQEEWVRKKGQPQDQNVNEATQHVCSSAFGEFRSYDMSTKTKYAPGMDDLIETLQRLPFEYVRIFRLCPRRKRAAPEYIFLQLMEGGRHARH